MNQALTIGIDATIFGRPEFVPEAVFHLNYNHINSLIQFAEDRSFVLFAPEERHQSIKSLFPYNNLSIAASWQDCSSSIDHYHIVDQVTFLPGRMPPLLTVPKTIKTSLMLTELLPVTDNNRVLNSFPAELKDFYLHSLEMVSASAAHIFCADSALHELVKKILHIPQWQVTIIQGLNSVPLSFRPDNRKLNNLKTKLGISGHYVMAAYDNSDCGELYEIFKSARKQLPDLSLVCADLSKYQLNFPVNDNRKADVPAGVITNMQLTYFEWLELLSASAAFVLRSNNQSLFAVNEARVMQIPVVKSSSSASELVSLIKSSENNSIFNLQQLGLIWQSIARQTLQVIDSLP